MVTHGFHKKKSKRIPARIRYKVEKKVRDHRRKVKKQASKNKQAIINKKKKNIDIPNNLPFKDKLIQEAKDLREKEIERKKLLKSVLRGDIDIKKIVIDKPIKSKKKYVKKVEQKDDSIVTEEMVCE